MRTRTATIAAGLAAAASLAASVAPAHAANEQDELTFLQFPARESSIPPCQVRKITLSGKYSLFAFSQSKESDTPATAEPRTGLKLHGRYKWLDCLFVDGRSYAHLTTIRNLKTNGTIGLGHIEPGGRGTGTYEWGSKLRKD